MKIDFTNQTVLITGASRGIGAQMADDFAACGAKLILTATTLKKADELIKKYGESTRFYAVDFNDAASTEQFLTAVNALDRIDVCINNAGLARHESFDNITTEQWDLTNQVNLRAPFLVTRAVAEVMKKNSYGRIVNISSIWGHISRPGRASYTASKFGLRGLTISTAADLAKDNILVNAVSPGFTLTDMVAEVYSESERQAIMSTIPLKRLAEPSEVSKAAVFLASLQNSYITGQTLVVDGGYSIV